MSLIYFNLLHLIDRERQKTKSIIDQFAAYSEHNECDLYLFKKKKKKEENDIFISHSLSMC